MQLTCASNQSCRRVSHPVSGIQGADLCWWPSNENSHVEAVKMLIANGASTGGVYNEDLLGLQDAPTPLILAIRKGRGDFVAMLLERAASVDEGEREIESEREMSGRADSGTLRRGSADGGWLMRGRRGVGSSTLCMPLCTLKILKF